MPAGRLVYLDVFRAIAIFLVLGYHHVTEALAPHHVGYYVLRHWGWVGWTGVDLFFVLSGFLIGGLLLTEYQQRGGLHIARFYIRRGFKIWPSYVLFILVITAYIAVLHRHNAQLGTDGLADVPKVVWPYFLHIQNYVAPLEAVIAHTWSLSVEEHFYLVLPLVLLIALWRSARSGQASLAAIPWIYLCIAVVCMGWRTLNYLITPAEQFNLYSYYFPTHLRIDSLMAGVFLAYVVRFRAAWVEPLRQRRLALLLFSLACYAPAAMWIRDEISYFKTAGLTVLALGSMGFVLLAWFADGDLAARKQQGLPGRAPAWARFLAWIGVYSYSIYLWHLPFPRLIVQRATERLGVEDHAWTPLVGLIVFSVISIVLGMVMYRLVERPALALRDRLFPSRAGILPQQTPEPARAPGPGTRTTPVVAPAAA